MSRGITRRQLLRSMAASCLAPSVSTTAWSETQPKWIDRMGVELYTVRSLLDDQARETIEKVAAIGYRHCEIQNVMTLARLAPMLEDVGLRPTSVHFTPAFLTGNWELPAQFGIDKPADGYDVDAVIEDAHRHGLGYLVFPMLYPEERGGLDVYRKLAGQLNRLGEKSQAAGVALCYHNHNFELEPMEGSTPFATLAAELDPRYVHFEFDVFWAAHAGADPVEMMRRYTGRMPLIHLKDLRAGTPDSYKVLGTWQNDRGAFEEVGDGIIDFASVLGTASETGVVHCYVEQDHTPGDPVESLRKSFDYLRKLDL
jgi:sugar phosphate isomerase/epimerase